MSQVIVIGGGASGFFSAINIRMQNPRIGVKILERSDQFLTKVRISGGGRCNLTSSITDLGALCDNYPRGGKELRSVFSRFSTSDAFAWFESQGVELKTEADGRVFPKSDSSSSVIDKFLSLSRILGIELLANSGVVSISKCGEGWKVRTKGEAFFCDAVVVATGGCPSVWKMLKGLGLRIEEPVASLFSFDIEDKSIIEGLCGISSFVSAEILSNNSEPFKHRGKRVDSGGVCGDILLTHSGFSGPVILKLSSFGARVLHRESYQFILQINWTGSLSKSQVINHLCSIKAKDGSKKVFSSRLFGLAKRLLARILQHASIEGDITWSNVRKSQIEDLAHLLTQSRYAICGRTTNKQEFVVCGGVSLLEIDFKSFECKRFKNLYVCGEALDIDALTGGFNLQNAWSSAYIASCDISSKF